MDCPNCDYKAKEDEFSQIIAGSTGGQSWFIGELYDPETDTHKNIGSVVLLACPGCKTVLFNS